MTALRAGHRTVVFTAVLLTGCADPPPPAGEGPATGAAPCQPEPVPPEAGAEEFEVIGLVLEVCLDGHAHEFSPIAAIAPFPDGRIAVLQRLEQRVRFFDETGDSIASLGRSGQGPGEFENPLRMGWVGDTLWVYDSGNRQFTLIGPDLSVLGRTPQPPTQFSAVGSYLLRDGAALFPRSDEGGRLLVRVDGSGRTTHVLSRIPPRDAEEVGHAGAMPPLRNEATWAVAQDGSLGASVNPHLEGSDAGAIDVTVFTSTGDTVYSTPVPFELIEVPRSVGDSLVEARRERARLASEPDRRAALERSARVPPAYPPVSEAVLGTDGSIWFRGAGRLRDRGYFHVDREGSRVSRVPLPRSARILAADSGRIWTAESDRYGVPSIARYRLDRLEGGERSESQEIVLTPGVDPDARGHGGVHVQPGPHSQHATPPRRVDLVAGDHRGDHSHGGWNNHKCHNVCDDGGPDMAFLVNVAEEAQRLMTVGATVPEVRSYLDKEDVALAFDERTALLHVASTGPCARKLYVPVPAGARRAAPILSKSSWSPAIGAAAP